MLIQAGQSGRGQKFAARWGELVFMIAPTIEAGQKNYKGFKEQVAKAGRDPDHVRIAPATYIIVGETQAMAEDKRALIEAQLEGDRFAGAALGSAQLRFRLDADGPALHR